MAPVLVKSLNRLSRNSIIDLALSWLNHQSSCQPYLASNRSQVECDEEDYLYLPAENVAALRETYHLLRQQDEKELSKRDIIDRIVEGDWRRGLSLQQLAMIDFAYLEEHDGALKWSALRLVPLSADNDMDGHDCSSSALPARKKRRLNHSVAPEYPHSTAASFVAALKAEISPLVKAHYHIHRLPPPFDLSIVRLYITPHTAFAPCRSSVPRYARQATDAGRVMYIALPDSCPYIYISLSGSLGTTTPLSRARGAKDRITAKVDMAAMKKIVLEAIPKALSRPHERWALETTKLTTRSLKTMTTLRGNQKPGTGGGPYGVFVQVDEGPDTSPVDVQPHEARQTDGIEEMVTKRFGTMATPQYAPLDRVHVRLEDLPRTESESRVRRAEDAAPVGLTFRGVDVFMGLRQLAGLGSDFVDMKKMPAWMSGELGMSSLTV